MLSLLTFWLGPTRLSTLLPTLLITIRVVYDFRGATPEQSVRDLLAIHFMTTDYLVTLCGALEREKIPRYFNGLLIS